MQVEYGNAPYQQAPKILKQFFPACFSGIVTAEPSKSVLVRLELNVRMPMVDSWAVLSSVSTNKGNAKAAAKSARMEPSMMNIIQHDSTILQRQSNKNRRMFRDLVLSSMASANTSFPHFELDNPVAF